MYLGKYASNRKTNVIFVLSDTSKPPKNLSPRGSKNRTQARGRATAHCFLMLGNIRN